MFGANKIDLTDRPVAHMRLVQIKANPSEAQWGRYLLQEQTLGGPE